MSQDPTPQTPREWPEGSTRTAAQVEQPAPGDQAAATSTCPLPGYHQIADRTRAAITLRVRCDGSVSALDRRPGPHPWSTPTGLRRFAQVAEVRVDLPEDVGFNTQANGGWHASAAAAAEAYLDQLTREDHVAMAAKAHAAASEPAPVRGDVTGADLTAGDVVHAVEELRARLETVEPRIAEVDVFRAFARDLQVLYQALNRDTRVSRDELTVWSNPVGLVLAEALTEGEPDLDVLLAVAAIDDVDGISQRVDGLLDHVTSARDRAFDGGVPAALAVLDDDLRGLLNRIDTARHDERTVYLSAADVQTLIDAEALAADATGWLRDAGVPTQQLEHGTAPTAPPGTRGIDGSGPLPDEAGQPSATAEPDAGEVVKVFCAPHCPACDATVRSLRRGGVAFQKIELDSLDPAKRAEVVTGHKGAPVVQVPGMGTWSGHRPTQIERLIGTRTDAAAAPDPGGPR